MGTKPPYGKSNIGQSPPLVRRNLRILLLLLAVAAVFLAVNRAIIYAEASRGRGHDIRIEINPDPFPDTFRRLPFDFDVTVEHGEKHSIHVFLTLEAECPAGGVATLSGDAMGNACDGPIETLRKKIKTAGSRTWELTVTYTGSTGTYEWTIDAFKGGV